MKKIMPLCFTVNVLFHKVSFEPVITLQTSGTGLVFRLFLLPVVLLGLLHDAAAKLFIICTCAARGGLIFNYFQTKQPQ